jgi:hypothetical protein
MNSVSAPQGGWHWLGSVQAYSGTNGSSGQSANHSLALHQSHGTATHGPAKLDPSQNGSLGQHVNTTA